MINIEIISLGNKEKEIENIPTEEKQFDDGYKVVRKREVKLGNDEFDDGRKGIYSRYFISKWWISKLKTEIELFPMDKIYTEYTNVRKSQDEYRLKREINQSLVFGLQYFKR